MSQHRYALTVEWTGNLGAGTRSYQSYSRDHAIHVSGKPSIDGSSDPAFRGDATRHNPEDLFLASLSACHMLWYLHLCSANGLVVNRYRDTASGTLSLKADGSGAFSNVTLAPEVVLAAGIDEHARQRAIELHEAAHHMCFLANSVAFEINVEPTVRFEDEAAGTRS
jgi:organic hydroperoxide reductase OsmC/OhrA